MTVETGTRVRGGIGESVKRPDGKMVVAENAAGHVFWSEAETHEVENIAGRDMRALLIELKTTGKA